MKRDRAEIFCQEIIKGRSQRQAYYKAYPNSKKWKPETVDSKASTLANSEMVLERLAELREETAKVNSITRDAIITELKNIAFSNATDFVKIENGNIAKIKDLTALPIEKQKAIASIEQKAYGPSLKLNDKLKAIELLIKIMGYEKAETETTNEMGIIIMPEVAKQENPPRGEENV